MIHVTKRLSFAFLLAAGMVSGGCYGTMSYQARMPTAGVYVETAPPAPRVEYYDPRPGFIWMQGRWNWQGGQWVWMGGHWERERVGYYYEPGRWDNRGGRYIWVDGRWNAGGRVDVDHRGPAVREERREERREENRDHREERREERREDRDDHRGDRDHRH